MPLSCEAAVRGVGQVPASGLDLEISELCSSSSADSDDRHFRQLFLEMPEDYSIIFLGTDLAMMCQSALLSDLNFLVGFSEITVVAQSITQSIALFENRTFLPCCRTH